MSNLSKYIKLEGDKTIWTVVFLLLIISILVVYSVEGLSSTKSHFRNILMGLIAMYFVHKLKFKYFSKLSVVGIIISIFLLVFVFFIGMEINGAKRWISIGSLSFQPSDFAKIAILVFMSRQISKYRDYINNWKDFCWYLLLPLIITCSLILPSNFSTATLVLINGFMLMIFARIKFKFLLSIVMVSVFGASLVYFAGKYIPSFQELIPRSVTWVNRIDAFISPKDDYIKDEGHQLNESKIAIKNGGILGKGPGKGIQRHFLYAGSSDFVYAITVEQYGILLGGVFPMFLYLLFFYRCIIISQNTESVFGSLMVASLSFALSLQAAINMGVNVGLFPVTGQTLPLISKGGTSIIFSCIAIGIILSVSRDSNDREYEKA
ncbi:MAG: cell division protein FtsW [Flavobacteriales bacterium]|nr:cell division protein FtsW [Flavobacteriales bacterium]|tara:strand:+ start:4843 stop:5976 length:1134 start_codon:yes stop_codon:yes gene_type:complete